MQYNHLCIYNKHLPCSAAIIFITEIYTTFHLSINKKGFRKFSEAFYIFKGKTLTSCLAYRLPLEGHQQQPRRLLLAHPLIHILLLIA